MAAVDDAVRFTFGMLIVVLNAADVVTTRMLSEQGGTELNPLAGWLLDSGLLAVTKMVMASTVAVLLLLAPRRGWIPRAQVAVVAFYGTVVAAHLVQLALA